MKYHALFVIFEKAAKFEFVVCCKLLVALYGLKVLYHVLICYTVLCQYAVTLDCQRTTLVVALFTSSKILINCVTRNKEARD